MSEDSSDGSSMDGFVKQTVNPNRRKVDNFTFRAHVQWTGTYQLADTPTRGLDKSRTGQLADATGDFACLVMAALCNRGGGHYIFAL